MPKGIYQHKRGYKRPPFSKEWKDKIAQARATQIGLNEPRYKGEKVGYWGLHRWLDRTLGRPKKCQDCGTTNQSRYFWANISGLYKRDINDFKRLCGKCHKAFDKDKHTNREIMMEKRLPEKLRDAQRL
jgi:hypothetical protein